MRTINKQKVLSKAFYIKLNKKNVKSMVKREELVQQQK